MIQPRKPKINRSRTKQRRKPQIIINLENKKSTFEKPKIILENPKINLQKPKIMQFVISQNHLSQKATMSSFKRLAACGSLLEFSTGLILPKKIHLTPNHEFQMCLWKCVSPIPKICDHFQYNKIQPLWPRKDSLCSRTILRGRCDHSMVRPSPAAHSCTSTIMFKVNYTEVLCRIAVLVWCCVPRLERNQFNAQPNPNKPTHSPTLTQHYYVLLLSIFIQGSTRNKALSVGIEVVESVF